MSVAVFDEAVFKARYQEFEDVSGTFLGECFAEAGNYLSNTDGSVVSDITKRRALLNMLTAHIAYRAGALSADGQALPPGRISQASEGAVSVSFEDQEPTPGSGLWFRKTSYGAAFWQATVNYRSMRYQPGPWSSAY